MVVENGLDSGPPWARAWHFSMRLGQKVVLLPHKLVNEVEAMTRGPSEGHVPVVRVEGFGEWLSEPQAVCDDQVRRLYGSLPSESEKRTRLVL